MLTVRETALIQHSTHLNTWTQLNTPVVLTDVKGGYELGRCNVSATEIRTLKLLTHVCCLDMKNYPVVFLCLNIFCVVCSQPLSNNGVISMINN